MPCAPRELNMVNVALVVEDEQIIRTLLTDILKEMDYEVLETDNEEDAWNLFTQQSSDISFIYTDIQLRKGNGIELYRRIRSQSPSTPVVVSSSMMHLELSSVEYDRHGQFLAKPFTLDSFLDTVQQFQS